MPQRLGADMIARKMAAENKAACAASAAALAPSVGSAAVGALAPGASTPVTVSFTPEITGNYVPVPTLQGGASLIGNLVIGGVSAKTSTTVTVVVKAPLVAVAAGATVVVTCFRIP